MCRLKKVTNAYAQRFRPNWANFLQFDFDIFVEDRIISKTNFLFDAG